MEGLLVWATVELCAIIGLIIWGTCLYVKIEDIKLRHNHIVDRWFDEVSKNCDLRLILRAEHPTCFACYLRKHKTNDE